MMKATILTALVASASAFAPASQVRKVYGISHTWNWIWFGFGFVYLNSTVQQYRIYDVMWFIYSRDNTLVDGLGQI